ncbi:hypothetical protein O1R50_07850 [Glycomyces luteolus]|uniref:Vegetative cell wall protein gp1 n=1 Tax=Glycomyces luteolus TaxID=2670330 RepID=A0A9X3T338_9ACTN|nr:hypothetical protein [Glycomyces luteolus]MDA1359530.1 hypothetical protein [Glycomyces luteolus]
MTDLLGGFGSDLSTKLADRWLSLLAMGGALFVAACAAAGVLGQAHALDVARLIDWISARAKDPAASTVGGQVVLFAAVLAAAAAIGLAARALGSSVERAVLAADWRSWPAPLRVVAERGTARRRIRWDAAHQEYSSLWEAAARAKALRRPHDPEARQAVLRGRTAIALERPDRPTWSGDRMHAVAVRLRRDHRLELDRIWPHLWLTLPDHQRAEIIAARTAVTRASELGAWTVLYTLVAFAWWPSGVIALLLGIAAHRGIRRATDGYARLVEAAVRLHTRELAQQLGLDCDGPLPQDFGDRLGALLGSAPPVSPSNGDEPA